MYQVLTRFQIGVKKYFASDFPSEKQGMLYIDTEQARHHCQKVLNRILRLAKLPENTDPDNLLMLGLRK